ncbi:MAG: hypothetical protein JNJ60_02025 [Rhodocyclaceae bacterium]|nr:hypothetical protein [Rhodocyclaceae bacterium]
MTERENAEVVARGVRRALARAALHRCAELARQDAGRRRGERAAWRLFLLLVAVAAAILLSWAVLH